MSKHILWFGHSHVSQKCQRPLGLKQRPLGLITKTPRDNLVPTAKCKKHMFFRHLNGTKQMVDAFIALPWF